MNISPIVVTGLATGIVPMFVAILSYRQATRANRQGMALEKRKVDLEAFTAAEKIYKDAIAILQAQLDQARTRIAELEQRLSRPSSRVRRE